MQVVGIDATLNPKSMLFEDIRIHSNVGGFWSVFHRLGHVLGSFEVPFCGNLEYHLATLISPLAIERGIVEISKFQGMIGSTR